MQKKAGRILAILCAAAPLVLTGCSRSVLNYQIAECIGTLDMYENNEPVETPKMKAEREQRESEAALEKERQEALAQAAALALQYRYNEAVSFLDQTEILQDDERAQEARQEYQKALEEMYEYEGSIPHLCFTNLVVDPERAFDGDEYDSVYRLNMITLTEFRNILQALYDSGYVLIDLHSLAEETGEGSGFSMQGKAPVLPKGKKPLILSVDNLSYSSVRNGDGVATALTLTQDGSVAAVYTDGEGHERKGAYDVVPALEEFLEEHPDFSYQGARGVISVAGERGIFGYSVTLTEENEENRRKVKEIASALVQKGWTFASAGYSYQYMGDMNYETLLQDVENWKNTTGTLIGDCDTLLYPYGSEVNYNSEKAVLLTGRGFHYLVGMWADGDHTEVNAGYLRQTRRMVTGYVFSHSPASFEPYFRTADILDPARN